MQLDIRGKPATTQCVRNRYGLGPLAKVERGEDGGAEVGRFERKESRRSEVDLVLWGYWPCLFSSPDQNGGLEKEPLRWLTTKQLTTLNKHRSALHSCTAGDRDSCGPESLTRKSKIVCDVSIAQRHHPTKSRTSATCPREERGRRGMFGHLLMGYTGRLSVAQRTKYSQEVI